VVVDEEEAHGGFWKGCLQKGEGEVEGGALGG
jgi:hypothetical protein